MKSGAYYVEKKIYFIQHFKIVSNQFQKIFTHILIHMHLMEIIIVYSDQFIFANYHKIDLRNLIFKYDFDNYQCIEKLPIWLHIQVL